MTRRKMIDPILFDNELKALKFLLQLRDQNQIPADDVWSFIQSVADAYGRSYAEMASLLLPGILALKKLPWPELPGESLRPEPGTSSPAASTVVGDLERAQLLSQFLLDPVQPHGHRGVLDSVLPSELGDPRLFEVEPPQ